MKFFALGTSCLVNAGLLVALAFRPGFAPPAVRNFLARHFHGADTVSSAPAKVAAPTPDATARGLWSTLASDDLPTLIARLRAAGFPAATIRDIIRAEIAARYDARMRQLSENDPNLPFWKQPSPYSMFGDKRYEEMNRLSRERSALLRTLLSDPFLADGDVSAGERRRFGNLPRGKIDQLQRIEDDYAEMIGAVRAGASGILLAEDIEKIALLNREKRADLAAALSPPELADYEMRTAQTTSMLMSRLGNFEPSEAEFRGIFQAQQVLNEKFANSTFNSIDNQLRLSAQTARNDQIRAALGDGRYAEYVREADTDFQQLARAVAQAGMPRESAVQAYGLRDLVAQESNRIFDDPALTTDQKRAALQTLAQTARTQLAATLASAAPAYVKSADTWLTMIERGTAIRFDNGPPLTIATASGTVSYGGSNNPQNMRRLPSPAAPNP